MSFDDYRPASVTHGPGGYGPLLRREAMVVEPANVPCGTMIDVKRIVPPGVRFDLLMVSFHKYALATVAMSPAERLEVLEAISGYLSKPVVAAIEPCMRIPIDVAHDSGMMSPAIPR